MTVAPNHETKKLEVTSRPTKCKHYYFYFNDEEFGWMFLKIQTWFPYNVQIYINGREYLSKIFDKNNVKYEMYNNSFSYLEDFSKAQKLADNFLNQKLSDSFDGIVEKVNNILIIYNISANHYVGLTIHSTESKELTYLKSINRFVDINDLQEYNKKNIKRIGIY